MLRLSSFIALSAFITFSCINSRSSSSLINFTSGQDLSSTGQFSSFDSDSSLESEIAPSSSDVSEFLSSAVDCSPSHVVLLRSISKQGCPAVRLFSGHRCRENRRTAEDELRQCIGKELLHRNRLSVNANEFNTNQASTSTGMTEQMKQMHQSEDETSVESGENSSSEYIPSDATIEAQTEAFTVQQTPDCSASHVVMLRDISKQSCPLARVIKGHECRVNRRKAREELEKCTGQPQPKPADGDESEEMIEKADDVQTPISSEEYQIQQSTTADGIATTSTSASNESFETQQSTCSPSQVVLLKDVANQSCPTVRLFAGHNCRQNRRRAREQLRQCLVTTRFSEDEENQVNNILASEPKDE